MVVDIKVKQVPSYTVASLIHYGPHGPNMFRTEFDHLAKWAKKNWTSMSEYLKRLSEANLAVNVGTFVGHNAVRLNVMGVEKRPPTAEELSIMKALVKEAMEDGAFGLSTGLIYVPGIYSETTELIELSKVVAEANGLYSSHIRGEASTLKKAVQEELDIAREARIPVEILHHKAVGRDNWGSVRETLKMIENARVEGVDVNCDVYPYAAGNTRLGTLIPSWVFADGPIIQQSNSFEFRTTYELIEIDFALNTEGPGCLNCYFSLHKF